MKPILRLFLAWLLLLALPLQGYASARMPVCAPAASAAHAAGVHEGHGHASEVSAGHGAAGHDHAAMLRAQAAQDGADDPEAGPADEDGARHGAKAGSCASCCIGAAMAALPSPLPAQQPDFLPIPFRAGHLPSVDPALPERPPRSALA